MIKKSKHLERYYVAVNSCTLVVGVIGNVTAIIVILCSRSMRTLTDFYLLSLSVSDLLVLVTGVLNDIYYYMDMHRKYSLLFNSQLLFYTRKWIFQTSVNASILTVTAFTVERYLAIFHPFLVQSMGNRSRAKKIIVSIWLVGAIVALVSVLAKFICLDSIFNEKPLPKTFEGVWPYVVYTRVILCFILPMLLILVMYTLIGIKLKRTTIERQNVSQRSRANTKALKMFAVIIIVFFISWAPYNLNDLMYYLDFSGVKNGNSIFERINEVRQFTYTLSPSLNPVIYVMMSRKFRESFKNLLPRFRKKTFNRVAVLRSTQTNFTIVENVHL